MKQIKRRKKIIFKNEKNTNTNQNMTKHKTKQRQSHKSNRRYPCKSPVSLRIEINCLIAQNDNNKHIKQELQSKKINYETYRSSSISL
jgi:hypothetical protein